MPRISEITVLQQMHQPILSIELTVRANLLPQAISESSAKLDEYLDDVGETLTDIPFVAYQNYENIDENNVRVTIGFPVSRVFPGRDRIRSTFLPKGKIVCCMYIGAYSEMISLYREMSSWIRENGYEPKGTAYEYYYDGNELSENQMLIKIVIPVR